MEFGSLWPMPNETGLLIEAAQVITCAPDAPVPRGSDLSEIGLIEDGSVAVVGDRIEAVGPAAEVRRRFPEAERLRFSDHVLGPGFVDSHTHAVFGRWRLDEYEQRCAGISYKEIAEAGGGINASVQDLRGRSEAELVDLTRPRLRRMLEHGTTTVEVKSGYGLTLPDELKMLRAVRTLNGEGWIDLVPTFLGAHSVPTEHAQKRDRYIALVVDDMIPAVAEAGLAVYCDVFMEPGVFSRAETETILAAAIEHGLVPKLHADELEYSGGAEVAVDYGAASADHLGAISEPGIAALSGSDTVATLLPGTLLFLGRRDYAPARELIARGAAVALATDFNPGSSPTWNVQLILTLACSQMGLSPAEAFVAATAGGAAALRLVDGRGRLRVGAPADLALFDVPDYRLVPYLYGTNHCVGVWKRGRRVH